MPNRLRNTAAAESARVPIGDQPLPSIVSYKPSCWYFRQRLRESTRISEAVTTSLIVTAELEQLRAWAGEQEIIPQMDGVSVATECMRHALRASRSHEQSVMLGLYLCHELEQLKAAVRESGLIPPKWIVDPREAEEKGWALRPVEMERLSHA